LHTSLTVVEKKIPARFVQAAATPIGQSCVPLHKHSTLNVDAPLKNPHCGKFVESTTKPVHSGVARQSVTWPVGSVVHCWLAGTEPSTSTDDVPPTPPVPVCPEMLAWSRHRGSEQVSLSPGGR
jgi:hypothetical protein